jgi:cytochrome c-type biogenesis protein CcmF
VIAEFGLAALWLAAALSILQLALGAAALRAGGEVLMRSVRPIAIAQALLVGLSFLALIQLFLRTDLSVSLVVATAIRPSRGSISSPAHGEITKARCCFWVAIWRLRAVGSHCSSGGSPSARWSRRWPAQAAIGIGFYAFLLFASNPFERVSPAPADGNGLNPLLQDPGLAFHPPTLYLGYVGISIAFSLAVGALITRDVGPAFARAMRPWVLAAW